MIDNLLHHFRLVEFARDAADHRMLDEIAQRSEAGQGGQEIGRRVRTHTILPLVPRQRRVAERAGL
ncbi:hypothetical protein ACH4PU_00910 [Streptomyces sp. NPDC021100]|uniref:hypothetical protein n=1 Tax=Streptomyces sp. NPDC021100 TaxID=3365114 RepID=UPI003792868A